MLIAVKMAISDGIFFCKIITDKEIKERVLMNELIKNIPTFMCHLAFVDKDEELLEMNGSDIDLFWVLVLI